MKIPKECEDCGGPLWDNRDDKKNPNSPDFKCKDKSCGWAKWLTEKGDPSRKGAGKGKARSAEGSSERDTYWADKTTRDTIESLILRRQSAQGKALSYAAMSGIAKPGLKQIIEWTDHFEIDAMSGVRNAKAAALQGKLAEVEMEQAHEELVDEDEIEI